MMPDSRLWSTVASPQEQLEREEHARRLLGASIRRVRYFDLDYWRHRWDPSAEGPRHIAAAEEWVDPAWACDGFDSVGFGIELATDDGRLFSVTWDSPGPAGEGVGIREQELVGSALKIGADVAVWDVTHHGGWGAVVGEKVSDVVLHYEKWADPDARWCPRMTIHFGDRRAQISLGDVDENGRLGPSSDNLAVVFETPL